MTINVVEKRYDYFSCFFLNKSANLIGSGTANNGRSLVDLNSSLLRKGAEALTISY